MRTFWDKQPVPQEGAVYESGKEIEKEKNVVNEPIKLPDGFSWDKPKLEEAHKLLNAHYVCDETFRLTYSLETLKWAAEMCGYENRGIRHNDTGELIGYISSVPTKGESVRGCSQYGSNQFSLCSSQLSGQGFCASAHQRNQKNR
jgi:glycylpeptide N-tetradecanoyltransferase